MTRRFPVRPADIRGVSRLAIDATIGLTRLVETMHHTILRTPWPLEKQTQEPTRGITGLVYRSIQGTTRLVGRGIEALLAQLTPLLEAEPEASSETREALLAALNGVIGDHLAASANPLAIPMQLRRNGQPLALTAEGLAAAIPKSSGKILLLLHGLCMNDLKWRRNGHDHGAALATAAGFTPLYLHYNSGQHVSTNGRAFAAIMETLPRVWPVPVEELVIVGHSMGGLVAHSACHYARHGGQKWLRHLRQLVFLGTPHHGAPLERGGNWLTAILERSPYTTALARLGNIRSAGITDLRHGSLLDDDWRHGDRFARNRKRSPVPLPEGVQCYAIAASIAKSMDAAGKPPPGDGLVPVPSALGEHADPRLCLNIPKSQQWIGYDMHHLDLLDNAEVYTQLRSWLCQTPKEAV